MGPGDLARVLREEAAAFDHIDVVELPGWRTRGRPGFDPRGAMYHHTAGTRAGGPFASLNVCTFGRAGLRNSLCHVHRSRIHRGRVTLTVVAARLSWHAGAGAWAGLRGNPDFWGLEAENDGLGEPWQIKETQADLVALTAFLRLTPRPDPNLLAGHREFARPHGRKTDPRGVDLPLTRWLAGQLLAGGSTPGAVAAPTIEELPAMYAYRDSRTHQVFVADGLTGRHVDRAELNAFIAAGAFGSAAARKAAGWTTPTEPPVVDGHLLALRTA